MKVLNIFALVFIMICEAYALFILKIDGLCLSLCIGAICLLIPSPLNKEVIEFFKSLHKRKE